MLQRGSDDPRRRRNAEYVVPKLWDDVYRMTLQRYLVSERLHEAPFAQNAGYQNDRDFPFDGAIEIVLRCLAIYQSSYRSAEHIAVI